MKKSEKMSKITVECRGINIVVIKEKDHIFLTDMVKNIENGSVG